jgi:hypothetical protein
VPRNLKTLNAEPGFAPSAWQAPAPDIFYSSRPAVSASDDFNRIFALPRRARPVEGSAQAEALIDLMFERYAKHAKFCNCTALAPKKDGSSSCLDTPKLVQAWALHELSANGGLLCNIGVGSGKTLLNILAPLAVPCKTAVVLLPSSVADQTIAEYELIRNHWRVPSLVNHGSTTYSAIVPDAPTLHILPYSRLQLPQSTSWLREMKPDLIIADECHSLKNPNTARTSRFLSLFDQRPSTMFAGWTGSLTESSPEDYAHLAALALRERSPVPISRIVAAEWAGALSPSDNVADPGVLLKFCNPGENVRSGYYRRFVETPGIITTTGASVDVPLVITDRAAPPIPADIKEMLSQVRGSWTRPDGEELVDALSMQRCCRELACGIYYRWIFPRGEQTSTIVAWLAARKDWNRELRQKLWDRKEHLDSEKLCTLAAQRAHGELENTEDRPEWRSIAWPAWRDIRDQVRPETQAVRVNDYLVQDAAEWSTQNLGVIWYAIDDFGSWLSSVSGLPKHGGGSKAPAAIKAERGDRSIVASIKSHGTGRNGLQYLFDRQLVAQPPSSNKEWEQLLGRLHRHGQSSSVTTEFYRHTKELKKHVDSALEKALYVEQTMGTQQKIQAGWQSTETTEVF